MLYVHNFINKLNNDDKAEILITNNILQRQTNEITCAHSKMLFDHCLYCLHYFHGP